jgi:putative flippase GtrA
VAQGLERVVGQFLRFGVVGVLGFFVDTATVYALRFPLGLYAAGACAYVTAASANWLLNRVWTFRATSGDQPAARQWVLFVLANGVGFILNRGTFFFLVATVPLCVVYPVLAVAAGSVAGMLVNFALSRRVFGAAAS